MSWTQVYVTGLLKSIEPSDEAIEDFFDVTYRLSSANDDDASLVLWAGPGTTLVKRDRDGACRGFCFLAFYSAEGAAIAVERINNINMIANSSGNGDSSANLFQKHEQLRAELSSPKTGKEKKKTKGKKDDSSHLPDLRIRKMRKPPIRKHPVITNSDGSKTNLGNKTK